MKLFSEEAEDTQYRLDMEKLYREEYMIDDDEYWI